MSESKTVATAESGTVARRETSQEIDTRVRQRVAELVKLAPVEVEGEGRNRLIDRILSVDTIEEMSTLFEKMDNSITMAGRPLRFHGIVLRESKFDPTTGNQWGIYLTVFAYDIRHKTEVTFNVGAETMCMMLLVANARGWYPFVGTIERKELDDGKIASNLVFGVTE